MSKTGKCDQNAWANNARKKGEKHPDPPQTVWLGITKGRHGNHLSQTLATSMKSLFFLLLGNIQGQIKISVIFRFKAGGHPANGARYLWGILQCQNYFGISSVALEQGAFSCCLSAAENVQQMRGGGWTTLEIRFFSTNRVLVVLCCAPLSYKCFCFFFCPKLYFTWNVHTLMVKWVILKYSGRSSGLLLILLGISDPCKLWAALSSSFSPVMVTWSSHRQRRPLHIWPIHRGYWILRHNKLQ